MFDGLVTGLLVIGAAIGLLIAGAIWGLVVLLHHIDISWVS